MPLTRTQKEQRVTEVTESLKDAVSLVFLSYDALDVVTTEELRDTLHEQGVTLRMMPKRLLKIVAKNIELDFDPVQQAGQMAVVWGSDPIAPAKALFGFAKKHKEIRLVAGTMDGKLLDEAQVKALAQIPGREQLLAQLVSVLAGPMRGFVSVLSGNTRKLVYVLQAVKEAKEKSA
jgi:large subunit ribosomal protein L10